MCNLSPLHHLYCMIKLKPEPLPPHSSLIFFGRSLFFHSRPSLTESVDIPNMVLCTFIMLSKFHMAFNHGISCTYKFIVLFFMVFMLCLHFSSHWGWDDFCSIVTLADAYVIIFSFICLLWNTVTFGLTKGKKQLKYEPERGVTLKINYVNDTSLPPFK